MIPGPYFGWRSALPIDIGHELTPVYPAYGEGKIMNRRTGAVLLSSGLAVVTLVGGLLVGAFVGASPAGATAGPAQMLVVEGYPSPVTAGSANSFTVTAQDAVGDTDAGYGGTVHFTSSDGQAGLPPDYTFTVTDAGSHTFSAVLKTAGSQSITATEADVGAAQKGVAAAGGLATTQPGTQSGTQPGTQSGIVVNHDAANHLEVTGFETPAIVGVPKALTVTAKDVYDNIATGYRDPIRIDTAPPTVTLFHTFVAADNGSHTFELTFSSVGTNTVIANGTTYPIIGMQVGLVLPASALYHSLSPVRILDTRNGTGGFSSPVAPGATIAAAVTGVGGVPASGVTAVALNVTVTQPSAGGFLTVYPWGTTRPTASSLNFVAGQTVPNLVLAKVGTDGKVSVYNLTGTTHVIFDVVGWYGGAGAPAGSRFTTMAPVRTLDTRNGTGGLFGPVGPGGTIAVPVAGVGGVPLSGVTAVALNVTVTQPSAGGFLTVYPSGTLRPVASNLNFVAGETVPNMVMAKVGADGKVSVYNLTGTTHVIFDVVGWYGAEGAPDGSPFITLAPARILDTRNGTGGFSSPVGHNGSIAVGVTGVGGVPATGATAVALNVTVTGPTASGFLTVYPSGTTRPVASNLNFVAGQTVPNLVVAQVGFDGKVIVYNLAGNTQVIFDVVGWFGT